MRGISREYLKASSDLPKPSIDHLFSDVYEELPPNLVEQREQLKEHLRVYGKEYNLETFKDGKDWSNK